MAGVVALDLSRRGLRGVQVESPFSDRPKLTRFGAVAVPEGTVVDGEIVDERRGAAAIKELWKAGGFTTPKVVLAIGNRKVVVREVSLPPLPAAKRKAALRFAVEGQVPIDLDDAILDFTPLRQAAGDKQEGLLVAAARTSLESTVNAIERSGRQVEAIDFAGFALLRALAGQTDGTQAIINIGAATTAVLIATGTSPEFVRLLPSGGDDVTRSMSRALGIDFAEAEQDKIARGLQGGAASGRDLEAETVLRENIAALIESIRNTLKFYVSTNPNRAITRVLLTGGGSRLTGLAPVLTRALGVPTAHADALGSFAVSKRLASSGMSRWSLELAAPLGVALGGR